MSLQHDNSSRQSRSASEKRGVEDALAQQIQQVQDGWQKRLCPLSRKKQLPTGESTQKFVMVAHDYARAHDTVDHRLLLTIGMTWSIGQPRASS